MQKQQLSGLFSDNPELLEKLYEIVDDELPRMNAKLVDLAIEMQTQFYTKEEIIELNKFYSTPIMREYIRRQPLLLKTMMEKMQPISLEFQETLTNRLLEESLNYTD